LFRDTWRGRSWEAHAHQESHPVEAGRRAGESPSLLRQKESPGPKVHLVPAYIYGEGPSQGRWEQWER